MATAAILPIKRFANAKQRLQPGLGAGSRQALASAMVADVISSLGRSTLVERLIVVTCEGQVRDAVFDTDVVLVEDTAEKGQSPAALSGLARAAAAGFDRAVLIPGDTPLIDPLEIDNLLSNVTVSGVDLAIVPDRHGTGTNALVLDPSGPFQPQFGPDSRERHEQQARKRGLRHAIEVVPSLLLDVDTPEDLAELQRAFDEHRGRAPRTQGVIRQFERSRRSALPA
jgi:2-phospho-L-lactate guanylyltransferase